jgi:glycosyltransferase involved in cell wall biosynthesis
VCSNLEIERVQKNYSGIPELICVPNAIDFDNYETAVAQKVLRRVVFQAGFAYGPNVDAAHFIIDDLLPVMQDFTFQFIGSNIPDWMRKSASAQVELLNNVDNMAPFLAKAGIVIIPLRAGAGTRLKALEAFASKAAVVSTALGVEGLGLVDGLHYLQAAEPQEFADACQRLVADPDLYRRITEAAFEHAQANYSLGVVSSILKSAID